MQITHSHCAKCRQYSGIESKGVVQGASQRMALSAVWQVSALRLSLPQSRGHFDHRVSLALSLPSSAFKASSPSPPTNPECPRAADSPLGGSLDSATLPAASASHPREHPLPSKPLSPSPAPSPAPSSTSGPGKARVHFHLTRPVISPSHRPRGQRQQKSRVVQGRGLGSDTHRQLSSLGLLSLI